MPGVLLPKMAVQIAATKGLEQDNDTSLYLIVSCLIDHVQNDIY